MKHSLTASQPHSLTASQPHSLTASQPKQPHSQNSLTAKTAKTD